MGIFSRAANAYADAKQNAKAQQDADEQRMFQKMAVELGLRERGILPTGEAQQMQGAAQAAKAGAFLMPGGDLMTSGVETPQVQQVGPGYSRVSTLTPEYKAQVKERVLQQRAQAEEQSFRGLLQKAMAGDQEATAAVLAKHPTLANSVLKPKGPSNEEIVALEGQKAEARAKAAAKYRRPTAPRAPTTSKGASFEANWKGRRYQELVRGVVDRVTGQVITPGLSPEQAQAKVQSEWQGLANVIPPEYMKAAETDPAYAKYLRQQVGMPDDDEESPE